MQIVTPYLLFLGDAPDSLAAKVARGVRDWRPEHCTGQLRLPGCATTLDLPDLGIDAAYEAGARTLVVGVANRGGRLADNWLDVFVEALEAGMDVASGLHNRLTDVPRLVEAAEANGRRLIDVRVPARAYPIADGERRSGRRCLAVGTDCSVGKMYTTLAIERAMHERGMAATFRATGQTGILITGEGVPLDAVVADFMSGAIEALTPAADDDHWDIIEGQGSLHHPSFSGVSLALIHGGVPDALVICHEPTREHMRGLPGRPLPSIGAVRDLSLELARIVNPDCRVVGLSINTAALDAAAAERLLGELESEYGLPAVDPFRDGAARLVDAMT